MGKLKRQVLFTIAVLFFSILALALSAYVKLDRWPTMAELLTADFIFALISSLASTQGSRWIDGMNRYPTWNFISWCATLTLLLFYGVLLPRANEVGATDLITASIWIFGIFFLGELFVTYLHCRHENHKQSRVAKNAKKATRPNDMEGKK